LTGWIEEWDTDLRSGDPLDFPGYAERLAEVGAESVRTGLTATHVRIEGDFDAFGGSMGVVHGERVVRAFDRACERRLPVVCVTRSGGARMQEGMVSLVQMGRVAGAIRRHSEAGLLSVAVMRSPTTGGVFASYASLCSLRAAEAGAVVGFAGPRLVEATTGEDVTGRSHSAETALAAGLVDAVLVPDELDGWVEAVLGEADRPPAPRALVAGPSRPLLSSGSSGSSGSGGAPGSPEESEASVSGGATVPSGSSGSAWGEVVAARRADRPSGIDLAALLCESWVDLAAPDPTLRSGLARIGDRRFVVLASDRHAGTGRPTPTAYRQARRAVDLAGSLGLGLVSLVDLPGAEPGIASENDGVAAEIAVTFAALDGVAVPTVAACVGEGGSGGALALAWADRLLVQEHATFAVIAPESAALILGRHADEIPAVAAELGLTSADLLRLGVVDGVIPDEPAAAVAALRAALDDVPVGRRRERPDGLSRSALA